MKSRQGIAMVNMDKLPSYLSNRIEKEYFTEDLSLPTKKVCDSKYCSSQVDDLLKMKPSHNRVTSAINGDGDNVSVGASSTRTFLSTEFRN